MCSITVVSFENQAEMKAVAIGLTTCRFKFLRQNWSLLGLFESLGLLSVKKTPNPTSSLFAQLFLHEYIASKASILIVERRAGSAGGGVLNSSWMSALGERLLVSTRGWLGCVRQVCWRTGHFFCSFHTIHECCMSAFSVVWEEGCSGHLGSTSHYVARVNWSDWKGNMRFRWFLLLLVTSGLGTTTPE